MCSIKEFFSSVILLCSTEKFQGSVVQCSVYCHRFRQLRRSEKELEQFNALPKATQEKLLGKFLAGHEDARKAFEKNQVSFMALSHFVNRCLVHL